MNFVDGMELPARQERAVERANTSRGHEASAGAAVAPHDDLLLHEGTFVDAQSLLEPSDLEPSPRQPASAASTSASTGSLAAASAAGGRLASPLADMDSALAINLDSLLQADFESVAQVLTVPERASSEEPGHSVESLRAGSAIAGQAAAEFVIHKGVAGAAGLEKGGGTHIPPGPAGSSTVIVDGEFGGATFDQVEPMVPMEARVLGPQAPDGGDGSEGSAAVLADGEGVGESSALTREALSRPVAPPHAPRAAEPAEPRHSPDSARTTALGVGMGADSPKAAGVRRSLRERAVALAPPAVRVLHLINRPLAMLPAKFHRMIDVISLSMLFWAAVVWSVVLLSPHHAGVSANVEVHAVPTSDESSAAPSPAHAAAKESAEVHH